MGTTLTGEEIAIISIGVIIVIAVIVAHVAQLRRTSKLPTREEFNALVGEVSTLKVEVAAMNARIDAAIRASEARIIKALINHRHPEPAGPPVFTEPL